MPLYSLLGPAYFRVGKITRREEVGMNDGILSLILAACAFSCSTVMRV
jgi:hypothetical protein